MFVMVIIGGIVGVGKVIVLCFVCVGYYVVLIVWDEMGL